MEELILTLSVALLFLIRIGIPVTVLVGLGVFIDRWQHNHQAGA